MTGRLLITGGTGFLGGHLLEAMRADGSLGRALALVRDEEAARRLSGRGVDTVRGALGDAERWGESPRLEECAGILHLAGLVHHSREDTGRMEAVNVEGSLAMVRLAARHGCRLVMVSTSGTVGCSLDPAYAPDEDAPFAERTVAHWPYYASKVAAERAARALADVLGVDLVIARPPVLLGPGDERGRSSSVLRRVQRRLPVLVEGGYHFTDARDVARALLAALRHRRPRPVYHLPGWNGTLAGFARLVSEVSGRPSFPLRMPHRIAAFVAGTVSPLGWFVDPVLVEMARHHWGLQSRHAERDLGYRPRDPRTTIRDAIAWSGAVRA